MKLLKIVSAVALSSSLLLLNLGGESFASNGKSKPQKLKYEDVKLLKVPGAEKDKEKIKEKANNNFKAALKAIKEYMKVNDIKLKADLDEPEFQNYVKQFALGNDSFSQSENEDIIKLVKFMDLYENFGQNEKIKRYKEKLHDNDTLTTSEEEELESLQPTALNGPKTAEKENIITLVGKKVLSVFKSSASAGSYSGTAARDYAYKWYASRNNSTYGYYSDYYDCTSCWNDCTNFVSQALKAGGKTYLVDGVFGTDQFNWYYKDWPKPSNSWGGAHNFYSHWKNYSTLASSSSNLSVGDPVNADFSGDGHIDHTAIVTSKSSSGTIYVTQHTSDKKDAPLSAWFNSGYDVYGWKIGTDSH